eukprot:10214495-Alexandrium_andersonii.AAC.1
MSSAGLLLSKLGRKRTGGRQHTALVSGRAATAAVCPPQPGRAIARGADAQRKWEGQAAPPKALVELARLVEAPVTPVVAGAQGPSGSASAASAPSHSW